MPSKAKKKVAKKKAPAKSKEEKVPVGDLKVLVPKSENVKEKLEVLKICAEGLRDVIDTIEDVEKTGQVSFDGQYELHGDLRVGNDPEVDFKQSTISMVGGRDATVESGKPLHNLTLDKSGGCTTVKDTMLRVLNDLTFLTKNMQ